jgi:hypothetical protein
MTTPAPLPQSRTGQQLARAAQAAGWTATVTPGHGTTEQTYLGDPRGDGTRPRLTRHVPCQSEAIHLAGPNGRRAVAVFCTTDGKSWRADDTWIWTTHTCAVLRSSPRALLNELRPAPDTGRLTT